MMYKVKNGPFQHSSCCLHPSAKNIPYSHEQMIVSQTDILSACVVVLGAVFDTQQSIQEVSLDVITKVCLQMETHLK